MSVERHEKAVTKRKGALKHLPFEICQALAIPEDVTIVTHEVIRHKQLTSECLIIEETCHITHHLFEIIALLDDMVSEILLRIPLADIGFMELFHIVVEKRRVARQGVEGFRRHIMSHDSDDE